MTGVSRFLFALGILGSAGFAGPASAAAPLFEQLQGEYDLTASTPVPASKTWYYTKARLAISKLDDNHLQILLACDWKGTPTAACDQHFFVQRRADGIYLDENDSSTMRIRFDPATRTLTMVTDVGDVRHDEFQPAAGPLTDAALVRRLQRAARNAAHPYNLRGKGRYSARRYGPERIGVERE